MHGSEPRDGALHPVTRLHWSDPCGRTGEDQISGFQRAMLRKIGDDLRNVPDKLGKIAALALHAIDAERNRALVWLPYC
jgi:hypothetical protein